MPAKLLIKLEEAAGIESARRIVKLVFEVLYDLWRAWEKGKILFTIFSDSLA